MTRKRHDEQAERSSEAASRTIVDELLKDFKPPTKTRGTPTSCPKCGSSNTTTRSSYGGETVFKCLAAGCRCSFPIASLQSPVIEERNALEQSGAGPGPFLGAPRESLQNVPMNRLGIPTARRTEDD